ncbi:MAG: hypothetical protein HY565_04475 [Candidatus Kerfeldbacteria bacterium]|nr:hypothetical protein [Candidatus Kerfeldbacteria bacterium]
MNLYIWHDLRALINRQNLLGMLMIFITAFVGYNVELAMWRVWDMRGPGVTALYMLPAMWLLAVTIWRGQFVPGIQQWRFVLGAMLLLYPIIPVVLINEYEFRLLEFLGVPYDSRAGQWYFEHISSHYGTAIGVAGLVGWPLLLYAPDPPFPKLLPFRLDLQQRMWAGIITFGYCSNPTMAGIYLVNWPYDAASGEYRYTHPWYDYYRDQHYLLWWSLMMIVVASVALYWYIKRLGRAPGNFTACWVIGSLLGYFLLGVGYALWLNTFGTYYRLVLMFGQLLLAITHLGGSLLWLYHIEGLPYEVMGSDDLKQRGVRSLTAERYRRLWASRQLPPDDTGAN